MKKLTLLFALCALLTIGANAQEFKPFRVGLGGGYAIPGGNGAKGGVLFYLEPSYRLQDQISLGLRMEWAALVGGFSEDLGSDVTLKVSRSSSYTVNGQYYFNNNKFRPFVGAGFGMYMIKGADLTFSDPDAGDVTLTMEDETKFGFYPRVGFDAGHFTLSLDYNLVGATTSEGSDVKMKNSYIGIRFGGFFGGGRN
jgi:hypothetical protein